MQGFFDVRCSMCQALMQHPPIKVPVHDTCTWEEENGEAGIRYDVMHICHRDTCIAKALKPLRKAVRKGTLEIKGQVPASAYHSRPKRGPST